MPIGPTNLNPRRFKSLAILCLESLRLGSARQSLFSKLVDQSHAANKVPNVGIKAAKCLLHRNKLCGVVDHT